MSLEIDGFNGDDDPVVVVVVEVVSVDAVVDVVSVDAVDVVSVDVGVELVPAGVVVEPVSVDAETVVVSVEPEDAPLPLSLTLPNAPATRKPITNSAMTATAVHDFFCGPPFFASGAIVLPLP